MNEITVNSLVNTPHGIGIVDAKGWINSLIKYLPEHDEKWRLPCEFRVVSNDELELVEVEVEE